MNKLETVLFVTMGAILFVVTNYLWEEYLGWFLFIMLIFSINILFNGLNYRNKSYYLINVILFGIFFPIGAYYEYPDDFKHIGFIFGTLAMLLFFYEYKKRENNPKKPWKNEW